jgi:hypothetical protein
VCVLCTIDIQRKKATRSRAECGLEFILIFAYTATRREQQREEILLIRIPGSRLQQSLELINHFGLFSLRQTLANEIQNWAASSASPYGAEAVVDHVQAGTMLACEVMIEVLRRILSKLQYFSPWRKPASLQRSKTVQACISVANISHRSLHLTRVFDVHSYITRRPASSCA